ncbi:MAG: glycosyltransferase [Rhodospirillaceae bacterium]|nr:MAG: glycosyltransferase [Rhodospirillaceae bacterium]
MNESPASWAGNAAIHYVPDEMTSNRERLMGRNVASEGFMRAFIRYADVKTFFCYADTPKAAQLFAGSVRRARGQKDVRWVAPDRPAILGEAGCLFTPDPGFARQAWRRRWGGSGPFSLCGLTHTTASHTAMDALTTLLTAPVQSWDALICTSSSVHAMVTTLLEG